MAIFYNKERLKPMDKGTFWLSQTPDTVSMGWDAACFRTVAWCRFKDDKTGKKFSHFNTHFDHRGEQARIESARLLLLKIREIAGEHPVVITGDFNTTPDSEPYNILTNGSQENKSESLQDSRLISVYPHHGPTGSFSGFKQAGIPGQQIDFIFIKNGVRVIRHGILSDTFDGRFPSDHLPVLAEFVIK